MLVDGESSQHSDDSVPIWEYWGKKDTLEQRKWLGELCLSHRQRPVRGSTEEPGIPKMEEIEDGMPGTLDGAGERDLNVVDATKEPKLTIAERNRHKTNERPCPKEEWRGVPNKNTWEKLLNLGCAFHGPMEEEKEEPKVEASATAWTSTRVVQPQITKPPPPLPPSTLGNDRREEKGRKGQGKSQGNGPDKGNTKGKKGAWIPPSRNKGGGFPYRMLKKIENAVSIRATLRESINGVR